MRYWVFQNNQVMGPYGREELTNVASFSAESLVCPEGRRGTQMGDWQRAGVVAELAETLLKMARVPAGGSPDPGSSLLPPEPTLRDLAVLGTLQEKVELLENSISQLHEDLRQRDEEISTLRTTVDVKGQEAALLRDKLTALEAQMAEFKPLSDEVAALKSEASRQTLSLQELGGKVETFGGALEQSIHKLEAGQGQLKSEIEAELEAKEKKLAEEIQLGEKNLREEIGSEIGKVSDKLQPAPPAAAAPAPLPAIGSSALDSPPEPAAGFPLPPMEQSAFAPPSLDAPASAELQAAPAPMPSPFDAPPPAAEPPADLGLPAMAPPPVDAPPIDAMPPMSEAPPLAEAAPLNLDAIPQTAQGDGLDLLAAPPSTPAPAPLDAPSSLFNEPAPGLADLGMPTPAPAPGTTNPPDGLVDLTGAASSPAKPQKAEVKAKGKSKKGMIIVLLVLGALGAGFFAVWQGIVNVPGLSPMLAKKKAPAAEPVETGEVKPPVDPVKGLPDRAQEAVESAKNYLIPRTGKTLASTLEGPDPQPGVSPWTVSPSGGDRYEVKFYSVGPGGPKEEYVFDVQLDAGIIRGTNAVSQAVLNGEKPAATSAPAPTPGSGKKRRPRPRPAAAKPAKSQDLLSDPLGDLLNEPSPTEEPQSLSEPEAAEPEAAPPPRSKGKAKKSKEELTLDELLLPGMPAR
ncbi:MAG: hypothetical protein WC728_07060 [Elusimicrobiota bacterium]